MSVVKSFSVNNGDMFYILHGSDNFTIIDCCMGDANREAILDEIEAVSSSKDIKRFISTHPDEDHILGLEYLDARMKILNFYCVKNETIKEDQSKSFVKYCELKSDEKIVYHIYKGCKRRWVNQEDDVRKGSGLSISWPDLNNPYFIEELDNVKLGHSPNNISPIIRYASPGGSFLWMGDLENEFMIKIKDEIEVDEVDIIFAPHHGRDSGKIPDEILLRLNPKIVIIGEAPSQFLHYYSDYNTITQNSAGDIVFDCNADGIDIFTSKKYEVDFLINKKRYKPNLNYIGSLNP